MTYGGDLNIRWKLIGSGSAKLLWDLDGKVIEVHASYLSDAFCALLAWSGHVALEQFVAQTNGEQEYAKAWGFPYPSSLVNALVGTRAEQQCRNVSAHVADL